MLERTYITNNRKLKMDYFADLTGPVWDAETDFPKDVIYDNPPIFPSDPEWSYCEGCHCHPEWSAYPANLRGLREMAEESTAASDGYIDTVTEAIQRALLVYREQNIDEVIDPDARASVLMAMACAIIMDREEELALAT